MIQIFGEYSVSKAHPLLDTIVEVSEILKSFGIVNIQRNNFFNVSAP